MTQNLPELLWTHSRRLPLYPSLPALPFFQGKDTHSPTPKSLKKNPCLPPDLCHLLVIGGVQTAPGPGSEV